MTVRRWIADYADSPAVRMVSQQAPHTVAWLGAAWRTLPAFVAIVIGSALAGLEVNPAVLAVTWPTLTYVLLATNDETSASGAERNAGPPAE